MHAHQYLRAGACASACRSTTLEADFALFWAPAVANWGGEFTAVGLFLVTELLKASCKVETVLVHRVISRAESSTRSKPYAHDWPSAPLSLRA